MRRLILAAMAAGMVWAQQQDSGDQQQKVRDALQRLDALARLKEMQKYEIVQRNASGITGQIAALQAELAAVTADAATMQARLDELHQRYTDSYPDVAQAKARLQQFRAQQYDLERAVKRLQYLRDNGVLPPEPAPDSPKLALPDRWWRNQVTSQYLGLTADQQKKMDDVVEQFRVKLVTNNVILQTAETAMQPLVSADPPDEARITAQIDRVAEARAELEKTNGRMLLGLRKLLTPEQWVKLNQAFTLKLTQ